MATGETMDVHKAIRPNTRTRAAEGVYALIVPKYRGTLTSFERHRADEADEDWPFEARSRQCLCIAQAHTTLREEDMSGPVP